MILNYTTTISCDKTISEITKILVSHGVSKVTFDYVDGLPVNLTFVTPFKNKMVFYSLPCRFEGIFKKLQNQNRVPKTQEQALKIGWRILKDWVESQLAIVEAGLAELPEVFLTYGCTNTGERLYDYIKNSDILNLNA